MPQSDKFFKLKNITNYVGMFIVSSVRNQLKQIQLAARAGD
jgi:hypothetical protein